MFKSKYIELIEEGGIRDKGNVIDERRKLAKL